MNSKNFENLDNAIYYTGFGDLSQQLKEQMQKNRDSFTLTYKAKHGEDEVVANLNFRKSNQSDMYFFNSYDMVIKNGEFERVPQQRFRVDNTFYRDGDGQPLILKPTINQKEAYNLMCGRSVCKNIVDEKNENEVKWHRAWIQLDFKDTDERGNFARMENPDFKLEEHLAKLPIKETGEFYRPQLIDSLERGNRQLVTFKIDGDEVRGYIEANPKYNNIRVMDENQKPVLNFLKDVGQRQDNALNTTDGIQQRSAQDEQNISERKLAEGQQISELGTPEQGKEIDSIMHSGKTPTTIVAETNVKSAEPATVKHPASRLSEKAKEAAKDANSVRTKQDKKQGRSHSM